MAGLELVFATPIARILMEPIDVADELRELILNRQTEDYRHPNSPQRYHEGVFESRFDFLTWEDDVVVRFRNALFAHLGAFVKEANGFFR